MSARTFAACGGGCGLDPAVPPVDHSHIPHRRHHHLMPTPGGRGLFERRAERGTENQCKDGEEKAWVQIEIREEHH